jgi:hypothetical protein
MNVLKEKYQQMLGKFVSIAFTYHTKKAPKPKYIEAYGHIIKVEPKNLLFKDNDNIEYIVSLDKIYWCALAGKRRTLHDWQKIKQDLLDKYAREEHEKLKIGRV